MKKFLSILFIIMSVLITSCSKQEEQTELIPEHNYAINDIKESDESSDNIETSIESTQDYENVETEKEDSSLNLEFHDMLYNTKDDINVHEIINMNTISIDGKLVAFPCNFDYLLTKFDSFYTQETLKYTKNIPVDGTETGTEFEIYTDPITGEGSIMFKMKSTDGSETTLSQMMCVGYRLQGGNYDGNEVMTCALPNLIKFGSSVNEIYDYFGQLTESESYSKDNDTNFMLFYSLDDIDIQFTGYDGGLYSINIDYKNYNTYSNISSKNESTITETNKKIKITRIDDELELANNQLNISEIIPKQKIDNAQKPETKNVKKQVEPKGIVTFEKGVTQDMVDGVYNNYIKVSDNVRKRLENDGYQILITYENLSKKLNFPYKIQALYDAGNKTIFIDNRDVAKTAIIHEIGHYVDYQGITTTGYKYSFCETFLDIYARELTGLLSFWNTNSNNYNTVGEYFAECFYVYYVSSSKLLQYCPETYQYIANAISDM